MDIGPPEAETFWTAIRRKLATLPAWRPAYPGGGDARRVASTIGIAGTSRTSPAMTIPCEWDAALWLVANGLASPSSPHLRI
jgi:hypothetical protein